MKFFKIKQTENPDPDPDYSPSDDLKVRHIYVKSAASIQEDEYEEYSQERLPMQVLDRLGFFSSVIEASLNITAEDYTDPEEFKDSCGFVNNMILIHRGIRFFIYYEIFSGKYDRITIRPRNSNICQDCIEKMDLHYSILAEGLIARGETVIVDRMPK